MQVRDLIYHLEISLLTDDVRKDVSHLNKLIHDDFTEFGSSGIVYNKKDILDTLPKEGSNNFIDSEVINFDISCESNDFVAVKYILIRGQNKSLRSSIWQKFDGSWMMIFHQGTNIV